MNIFFFDLDGPILDVSEKYYRVYHDLLKQAGYPTIDKNKYWEAKRSRVPESEILALTGASSIYDGYRQDRVKLIETTGYQRWDLLQPSAMEVMKTLSGKFKLALVTLRTRKEQTLRQLHQLGIDHFFDEVLCRSGDSNPEKWKIKVELIREWGGVDQSTKSYFIGDTETDIRAAKAIGATSIAVLNGIRSKGLLEKESPDHLISGIEDLPRYF